MWRCLAQKVIVAPLMGSLRTASSEKSALLSLHDSWEVQLRISASDPQIPLQRNGLHPKKDGIKKTR